MARTVVEFPYQNQGSAVVANTIFLFPPYYYFGAIHVLTVAEWSHRLTSVGVSWGVMLDNPTYWNVLPEYDKYLELLSNLT